MGPACAAAGLWLVGTWALLLAGLFALRRLYLRRPLAGGGGDGRLRRTCNGGALRCRAGRLFRTAWREAPAALLVAVHAWFPGAAWRDHGGLGCSCSPSGRVIRAAEQSAAAGPPAIVETGAFQPAREVRAPALPPALGREALLSPVSAPPPRLGTGFLPSPQRCCWLFGGLGLWLRIGLLRPVQQERGAICPSSRRLSNVDADSGCCSFCRTLGAGRKTGPADSPAASLDLWSGGHSMSVKNMGYFNFGFVSMFDYQKFERR